MIGVTRHPVPILAIQKLEHRYAECLALDVEQSGLDRTERGAKHRARAPIAVAMELLHERVRLERIAADEPALQLFERDAVDAFVRMKLHEDEIRARNVRDEGLEAGDPHSRRLAAGRHAGEGLGLKAVGHHLHEFDAMAVRILDPGLPIAVGAHLFWPDQGDTGSLEFAERPVDIRDL